MLPGTRNKGDQLMRRSIIAGAFAIAAALLGAVDSAHAYTFTLNQQYPDIFADFLTVSYTGTGGTGTLTASGFASTLTIPPGNSITGTTTYTLTANISSENLASGSLTIDGKIAGLGYNSGVLLTGTLTGLSVQGGQDIVYVTFTPTGGDAKALYGKSGGIILNLATLTPPSSTATFFNANFSSNGNTGVSDNFSTIPEPLTGLSGLMGLGALAITRRRHGRRV
jgi:hypothetical protein